ncbi:hypothetical protein CEXT_323351 [Caerostris extrusa]|uniref:Uncharacterized protein n=1 Tax=Caerostris extrusa TaxID=172846 RepID=A0AAV4S7L9_CAEEX|nr:hypothetical protein CEXT_323351 [Caerostris extrusa]
MFADFHKPSRIDCPKTRDDELLLEFYPSSKLLEREHALTIEAFLHLHSHSHSLNCSKETATHTKNRTKPVPVCRTLQGNAKHPPSPFLAVS